MIHTRFNRLSGLVLLVITLLGGASAPALAATQLPPDAVQQVGIAATVNDDAITFSDIRNRFVLYTTGSPQKPPPEIRKKLEMQILDKLIDEKLQLQEAKKIGITVSDDDVKHGFDAIAQQNKMTADEFRRKLEASGVNVNSLYDQIRAEVAWSQVVRRKLRPQISVSESEIDRTMDQMMRTKGVNEYLVAEILLLVPSAEMEDTVRHDADGLIAELHTGKPFPEIARQYSKAPGASTGGDLGWIKAGTLDAKLDDALSKMHPGQLSPPIRTDKGYHILFLRDMHEAGSQITASAPAPAPAPAAPAAQPSPAPQAPAKAETIVHLKQITIPIAKNDPDPVVNAKMNRAATLKDEITSCSQMEQKSKDFMTDSGDMGSGPISALPEPVRKAVENLPVGEVSAPIRGDNGVAVIMVCERKDVPGASPAPAPQQQAQSPAPQQNAGPSGPSAASAASAPSAPLSPNDDKSRDKVASQIGMKRLDQMQEHYLRDLRATAFIEKRL